MFRKKEYNLKDAFKPKDAFKAAIVPVVSEIELLKKLKCNYVHTERKWYIKKSDLELCSKDNAISEIEHILENVALYRKNKEYIRNSWKQNY